MTKKIEIIDEMVERSRIWQTKQFGVCGSVADTREMLDIVLNPPAEPEIPVSDAMRGLGCAAYRAYAQGNHSVPDPGPLSWEAMASAYRAMESQRRKEEAEKRTPNGFTESRLKFSAWRHMRLGDHPHGHRRKDDPA